MGGLNVFLATYMPPYSADKRDILAVNQKYNKVKIIQQTIDNKRFVGYKKIQKNLL